MSLQGAGGKKWRVFVSSTSKDLLAERSALEKALNQMGDAGFGGMEYFGSRHDRPLAVCLEEVGQSDVYVGIFAGRYGYVEPEHGRSMTELEYRHALSKNIPCLIYVRDENYPAAEEPEEKANGTFEKLRALKGELMSSHCVTTFKNPDELATKVVLDLHNLIRKSGGPADGGPSRVELHNLISRHLGLQQLITLCFNLGVDYEDLPGEGKSGRARELVLYMERRRRLPDLTTELRRTLPELDLG